MKKYTLFVLISLMTFNVFGLAPEEKDRIYEAIVAKAKQPRRSHCFIIMGESFEEDSDLYEKDNVLWESLEKDKEEAGKASGYLNSLPPSTLIPAFYELSLEGKLRLLSTVERYAVISLSETNKYDKSSLLYVSNKKAIVREKSYLKSVTADYRRCETSLRGPFIKRVVPGISYVGSLKAYWWLEGRRYMPEIWNDWYPCWQHEMARKEPRPYVVKNLIDNIAPFGTFIFPYLNEAIKEGDDSLASVLQEVRRLTAVKLPSIDEFCEWYAANHYKYDYPPCEGIRKTIERVTDPYIHSELKGEDTYDDKEKYIDKWAFGDLDRQMFKQILWKTEDYYKNREYPPNYWYYKIPDNAVIENDSDYGKYIRANKINERFLKKLEKERK